MTVFDSIAFVSTFCCSVDSSLPLSLAFARSRWTASMTSLCCARNASPRSAVHWMFSDSIFSASGIETRAWTLGSQYCCSAALVSSSPLRFVFFAEPLLRGDDVDRDRSTRRGICASSGSG